MMRTYACKVLVATCFALLASPTLGQGLQQSLGDLDVGDRWQYNDWESARAAAAKSNKPIFALFR